MKNAWTTFSAEYLTNLRKTHYRRLREAKRTLNRSTKVIDEVTEELVRRELNARR